MWAIPILIASIIYWAIYGINWYYFWVGSAGGIIGTIGSTFGILATVHAKGGPASSVIETAMIFQTIFDVIFLNQYPNFMEILGLIIGFLAGIVIVVGEVILQKVLKCCKPPPEQESSSDSDYESLNPDYT